MRQTENAADCSSGFIDSEGSSGNIQPVCWRGSHQCNSRVLLSNLQPVRGFWYTENVVAMRDYLTHYVNSEEGSVSWQWDCVRQT